MWSTSLFHERDCGCGESLLYIRQQPRQTPPVSRIPLHPSTGVKTLESRCRLKKDLSSVRSLAATAVPSSVGFAGLSAEECSSPIVRGQFAVQTGKSTRDTHGCPLVARTNVRVFPPGKIQAAMSLGPVTPGPSCGIFCKFSTNPKIPT